MKNMDTEPKEPKSKLESTSPKTNTFNICQVKTNVIADLLQEQL